MNSALKYTIVAIATVALSVTAACKSDEGPEELEATAGAEAATSVEASEEGEPVVARRNAKKAAEDSDKAAVEAEGAD
jgi:hypothetical protein